MEEITVSFNAIQMTAFIKDMLCISDYWERLTMDSKLRIKFKGDINVVRNDIYNWLDNPVRKSTFEGK